MQIAYFPTHDLIQSVQFGWTNDHNALSYIKLTLSDLSVKHNMFNLLHQFQQLDIKSAIFACIVVNMRDNLLIWYYCLVTHCTIGPQTGSYFWVCSIFCRHDAFVGVLLMICEGQADNLVCNYNPLQAISQNIRSCTRN